MTKSTVTRIWLIGVLTFFVGLVVGGVALGLMFAYGGKFVPAASGNGSDFIPRTDSYFWTTVSFIAVGCVIALAGAVAQLVAWVGALLNTYLLRDKSWFIVLLAGGLIGLAFGLTHFAVMIAYVVAGPDGASSCELQLPMQEPPMPRPTTFAHTG